jgi:hypothetical protein
MFVNSRQSYLVLRLRVTGIMLGRLFLAILTYWARCTGVRGWGAWGVAAVAPVFDLADNVVTHLVLSLDLSVAGDGEEAALGKAWPTNSYLPGLLHNGLLMRSCEVCRSCSRSRALTCYLGSRALTCSPAPPTSCAFESCDKSFHSLYKNRATVQDALVIER